MPQKIINNNETGLVVRTKLNDNFTELYGKANDLFNTDVLLEARIAVNENDIAQLQGQMSTAESDIDALQVDVALLMSQNLDARVTALEGSVVSLQNDFIALEVRVTATEADINSLDVLTTQHSADISDIYATAAFTDQSYADPIWI